MISMTDVTSDHPEQEEPNNDRVLCPWPRVPGASVSSFNAYYG